MLLYFLDKYSADPRRPIQLAQSPVTKRGGSLGVLCCSYHFTEPVFLPSSLIQSGEPTLAPVGATTNPDVLVVTNKNKDKIELRVFMISAFYVR